MHSDLLIAMTSLTCACSLINHISIATSMDAGPEDASSDGQIRGDGGSDSCLPGPETCNRRDDNCNGAVDEGIDVLTDRANCGGCGMSCNGVFCLAGECIRASRLSLGGSHSCALLSNGEVWCWGRNDWGELGDGTNVSRDRPVRVGGLPRSSHLSAGWWHTCALGDSVVRCWGRNRDGQLGVGSTMDDNMPSLVLDLGPAEAIMAGATHTCALRSGGGLHCWGDNSDGQLGNGGSPVDLLRPSASPVLSTVRALFDSDFRSTCVATATEILCFGLPIYTRTTMPTPTAVALGGSVVDLGMGSGFVCAVVTDGQVACLGGNGMGQLGNGSFMDSDSPTTVLDVAGADAIACGSESSCSISDGLVHCWGAGSFGQLGGPDAENSARPQVVDGLIASDIDGGTNHFCAILTSGEVACWGRNDYGQLGRGRMSAMESPDLVVWN